MQLRLGLKIELEFIKKSFLGEEMKCENIK